MADKRFRRFQLTVNDKEEQYKWDEIFELTKSIPNIRYFSMSEERGDEGTRHFHIYFEVTKRMYWTAVQKMWAEYKPNIESNLQGNSTQNREYVMCEGEHIDKKDKLINAVEWGTIAQDNQGKRTDIDAIIEMLDAGALPREIRKAFPKAYLMHQRKIQSYFQDVIAEKYMLENREIEVYYVYGGSGTGKTSGIYKKEGVENIYRVTNYDNPFDGYTVQDVIVLEEFHSQLQFGMLLQLTEEYPMYLKARYGDKVACFTKVYIVSNMRWEEQYQNIQYDKPSVFKAMDRRFTGFIETNDFGDFEQYFERQGMDAIELAKDLFGEDVKVNYGLEDLD